MKEIDWSKAPALATHWCPEIDDWFDCWYIVAEPLIAYFEDDGRIFARAMDRKDREILLPLLVPRPAPAGPAWNGEGLPPVGTVCEACWTSPDEYYQIKVLAHDDGKAVYRWQTGPGSGELSESEGGIHGEFSKPHPKFRPIRTPEQIKAEEREKAVDEMMAAHEPRIATRRFCEKLYDAGYRRQEPKE